MRTDYPYIKCKLVFIEGKRKSVPNLNLGKYFPHIVIGNSNQRHPLLKPGTNILTEQYLGVAVIDGPESFDFENEIIANLYLLYFESVDYTKAQKGQTFTLREGSNIVGFGEIILRVDH